MLRMAAFGGALVAGFVPTALWAQIQAQPARPFTPSPPTTTYSPAYSPASYSPTGFPPSGLAGQGTAAIWQSAEANQIRGWYRDYLGRDVGPDLSALVNLLRGGMSPIDLQATILGSDEFYSQKGRDPQTFVRETLQAVTWSEPSYADVVRWTDRLRQLRGDRFALAREILLQITQPPTQSGELAEIADRLVSAARLASDTIDFEIGGTPQGRQAHLQAQALRDATTQLQRSTSGGLRPDDVTLGLNSAERAYQALQSTLSNPPGTAPSASGIVRRIGTMLSDARRAAGAGSIGSGLPIGSYPPLGSTLPPASTALGYNPSIVLDQVLAARRATDSLLQTLSSQAYQDYTYNVVLRDLDTLASRLAALEPLVRSGVPRDRLQWEVQSLGDSASRVQTQLATGRLPYSARLYWQSLQSSLALLRDSLGVSDVTSPTTMLRPTALHDSLLPLVDQAAAQIDVFLAGTSPLVYTIPEVPSVQNDTRSLKNRVLTLRQQAGAGQPAAVMKQTLTGMIGDYQAAFDRWNRLVATYRLANPARLSPVGETLNRVEQMLNEALASGGLAQGPSRTTQDLAQLTSEVAEARRVLAAYAGYREQPVIDGYLEQIAGYIVQISDALARQSPGDARRLAVGMQGVIGRLQPQVDSLSQRLSAGTVIDQRPIGTDLQARAYRIGRLADDVEAQLY